MAMYFNLLYLVLFCFSGYTGQFDGERPQYRTDTIR